MSSKKNCAKYKDIFSESAMSNWEKWLNNQQQIWDHAFHAANSYKFCGAIEFPKSLSDRTLHLNHISDIEMVEDCALGDLPDQQETLTFSNHASLGCSEFGSFSKQDIDKP